MAAVLQVTSRFRKLWTTSAAAYKARVQAGHVHDEDQGESTADEKTTTGSPADNALSSPLLRLPAEIRNQIYSYLELNSITIEVVSLAKNEYNALDEKGMSLHHNPYPDNQCWYRMEEKGDQEFSLNRVGKGTPKKRCTSIAGLFALPRVCRQLRAETLPFFYQEPYFAFLDPRYNYAKAFPAFLRSLSPREKALVQHISWPFRQAREFHHSEYTQKPMVEPDRVFTREFTQLPNLKRVLLRYVASNLSSAWLSPDDLAELQALIEQNGGWDYALEFSLRRDITVRAMRQQLSDREDVVIECKKISDG